MNTKRLHRRHLSFIIFFLTILMSLAGCRTIELQSHWRGKEIIIDGTNSEWHESLVYIERLGILVGFLNDQHTLYACLTVSNPFQRAQIMREGLAVWFDPSGGNKKIWGIRFPIGRGEKLDKEKRGEEREDEPDTEEMKEIFRKSLTELEILGPGRGDAKRMKVSEAKGIEISLVPSSGLLVYELKIPLVQSEEHPYTVGALPGNIIGLGLESPRINMERGMRRMGGGMPGGGGGLRPPMGGGSGPGGFGGGMMPAAPKELKLWAKVSLAPGPSSK